MQTGPLSRDEWIVLLDYFFRSPEPTHTDSHPECRKLAVSIGRSPSTVDFSLRNLKSVRTAAHGMPHVAATARRVYSRYHNRLSNLQQEAALALLRIRAASDDTLAQALLRLRRFNSRHRGKAAPSSTQVTNVFDRPSRPRADLIDIVGTSCQVCGIDGFETAAGTKYVETHHLEHLSHHTTGNLCTDNVVVVCPTCHAKLHYAKVEAVPAAETIRLTVNGQPYELARNTEEHLAQLVRESGS